MCNPTVYYINWFSNMSKTLCNLIAWIAWSTSYATYQLTVCCNQFWRSILIFIHCVFARLFIQQNYHTAWIWIWMAKRQDVTSDDNFSSYLIGRSWYNNFGSFSMSGNGGLHWQGMANPANQLISEKLPIWHFLRHAWNLKLFWATWLHLKWW